MKQIILISSHSQEAKNILNGDATYLVLKYQLHDGDEVHIYCTKNGFPLVASYSGVEDNEKPIYTSMRFLPPSCSYPLNGKVVAKFIVGKVERIDTHPLDNCEQYPMATVMSKWGKFNDILKKACLLADQLDKYSGYNKFKEKPVYAIEITHLEIFDKPRELGEYKRWDMTKFNEDGTHYFAITHAPQSYMKAWVEE